MNSLTKRILIYKKRNFKFSKEREKLKRSLGNIAEMKTPDLIFIIDNNISLAVAEARKLGIPIVAVLDTNSDPTGIDFLFQGMMMLEDYQIFIVNYQKTLLGC